MFKDFLEGFEMRIIDRITKNESCLRVISSYKSLNQVKLV